MDLYSVEPFGTGFFHSASFSGCCCCCCYITLVVSDSVRPHRLRPTRIPPSQRFSRQEHWSGLPFPSLMHESESEVAQSCPTLSDPMDSSLLGSSVHGIFQARVLEWGAIAFSNNFLRIHPLLREFWGWHESTDQVRRLRWSEGWKCFPLPLTTTQPLFWPWGPAGAGAGRGSVIKLLSLDVKSAFKSSSGNSLMVHS